MQPTPENPCTLSQASLEAYEKGLLQPVVDIATQAPSLASYSNPCQMAWHVFLELQSVDASAVAERKSNAAENKSFLIKPPK
jgi:hypothetical protein